MLVEFRVKNFRCLRDEQVLSMVASKDKTLAAANTIPTGLAAAPALLKTAVIYGPNAGGKSTLLRAMEDMRAMVLHSATSSQEDMVKIVPFLLDEKYKNEPTSFEITFIHDGIRYQYGFSCLEQRIVREELLAYKTSRPQRLFLRERNANTDKDVYKFGPSLRGNKTMWSEATDSHTLFLSMAARLNSEQLQNIQSFFESQTFLTSLEKIPYTALKNIVEKCNLLEISCALLQKADISIANIRIVEKKVASADSADGFEVKKEFVFEHTTDNGAAQFTEEDESSGTLNLFKLSPFLTWLTFGESKLLLIDELNSSLHPLVVKFIVQLLHSKDFNKSSSQLIFTTHDTSMLDAVGSLFRRDQVWFVEKGSDQASTLRSLAEFSPRKGEDIEKGYFQGRYGGLPIISDWRG